ncbi:AraC family transcriptional regulator [Fodinibius roseus]|uniref:AraC family transcriptional regulator n=1 Tax=Fodinibius roseus TaxID=1194090 RepID=A0A1M4YRN4_9BACT|nr:AraC family transcriptional regulator [Fodinibius roseus]SHF08353.1 AraC family transcriptional regulator [Fodinibius roseus]
MDWLDKMNGAMNYIEDNLTTEIDYWEIARSACCSEYHLRRMFPFITGVSLSEYIRRRRLSLAAFELNSNNIAVRDVATKYGYSSPDAFTRAFKNWHGITPSDARKHGEQLKAYPRMIFHLSIEGGVEMNYRIEEKNTFNIVGIMKRVPIVFEGPNPEIESMWKELDEQQLARLKELSNVDPKGIISASTNFSEGRMEEEGELDHYIGVATTNKAGDNFAQLTVPVSTWAVFESIGSFPETLQETWGRIYSEWFPTSNYELAKGPEMLWNENKDTDSATFKSEIWIPVSEK